MKFKFARITIILLSIAKYSFAEGQKGLVTLGNIIGVIVIGLITLAGAVIIKPLFPLSKLNFPYQFLASTIISLLVTLFLFSIFNVFKNFCF